MFNNSASFFLKMQKDVQCQLYNYSKPIAAMIKLYPPKLFYCQNPLFFTNKSDLTEIKLLFERAVAESFLIDIKRGDEALLQLYSLYKQATNGDINIAPPVNAYDQAAKAKYDAWASLKGKSVKDAQSEYITLVHELKT